jgi:hypothetical protein
MTVGDTGDQAMAQPQVIQGSWEQLSSHADDLRKHRNLFLIIPAEEPVSADDRSSDTLREDDADREAKRIAAIHAGMGTFAYSGVGSEDLDRERKADKAKEERQIAGAGS